MRNAVSRRRGFSLLEVMIALSILTISLVILIQTQSMAMVLTQEAEMRMTATDLAQQKMAEALLTIESEGFQVRDVYERGDFDDFGGDGLSLDVGDQLEGFEWEYSIREVDITIIGEAAESADEISGDQGDEGGGLGALLGGGGDDGGGIGGGMNEMLTGALAGLGLGSGNLAEMLGPFVREVRVRVWWGGRVDEAEEAGNEVILTTHVFDPTGAASAETPGGGQNPAGGQQIPGFP
ncbi:MAG: prepilin-type N-terminal cleavage/methylation domain-containing protein [Myxococcota bacterium]